MSAPSREIVQRPGRPAGDRSLQPRRPCRRAAVLLGSDPARPGHRRAGRRDARRAGAPLPGEPAGGVRRRRARSLDRAVRLTVYMTDLAAFAEVNEVYGVVLRGRAPGAGDGRRGAAAEGRSGRDRRGRGAVGARPSIWLGAAQRAGQAARHRVARSLGVERLAAPRPRSSSCACSARCRALAARWRQLDQVAAAIVGVAQARD